MHWDETEFLRTVAVIADEGGALPYAALSMKYLHL
jgi:hypothetical protein